MTIIQTVDIPVSRRLVLDVPREVPAGETRIIIQFAASERRSGSETVRQKLQKLRGSLSAESFGGMDGVSYQREVRAEWDD